MQCPGVIGFLFSMARWPDGSILVASYVPPQATTPDAPPARSGARRRLGSYRFLANDAHIIPVIEISSVVAAIILRAKPDQTSSREAAQNSSVHPELMGGHEMFPPNILIPVLYVRSVSSDRPCDYAQFLRYRLHVLLLRLVAASPVGAFLVGATRRVAPTSIDATIRPRVTQVNNYFRFRVRNFHPSKCKFYASECGIFTPSRGKATPCPYKDCA